MKYSRQRERILDYLKHSTAHPSADMVYGELKPDMPGLSLATVYRNLKLLESMGEIKRLDTGQAIDRYDGNVHPHNHFICTKCGEVTDLFCGTVRVPGIDSLSEQGYTVTGTEVYIYGFCCECNKAVNN